MSAFERSSPVRRASLAALGLGSAWLVFNSSAQAASLTVSPVLIDAGAAANATLTLQNRQARPLDAQVRIFRWRQGGGEDQLTPADDVVASPPILTVDPNGSAVVRVQRQSREEPVAEEAYRIVVDELPNPDRQRNGTVAVVLRYLVPAFFFPPQASQPHVSWAITRRDGKLLLTATNRGDKRLQVIDLRLKTAGTSVMVGKGLAGYVLGRSERSWPLGEKLGQIRAASIVAASDHGPLDAPLAP